MHPEFAVIAIGVLTHERTSETQPMVENHVVRVNFSYWGQYRTGKEKSFISSILIDNLQEKKRTIIS